MGAQVFKLLLTAQHQNMLVYAWVQRSHTFLASAQSGAAKKIRFLLAAWPEALACNAEGDAIIQRSLVRRRATALSTPAGVTRQASNACSSSSNPGSWLTSVRCARTHSAWCAPEPKDSTWTRTPLQISSLHRCSAERYSFGFDREGKNLKPNIFFVLSCEQ